MRRRVAWLSICAGVSLALLLGIVIMSRLRATGGGADADSAGVGGDAGDRAATARARTHDRALPEPGDGRLVVDSASTAESAPADAAVAVLSGSVRDAGGGPIGGAAVVAQIEPEPSLSTVTDASGHYRIALPPGYYGVVFSSGGYAPKHESFDLRADRTLDVALAPASSLSGRVVDAAGRPVGGAEVFASEDRLASSLSQEDTTSGDDGTFSFDDLEASRWRISARADDDAGQLAQPVATTIGRPVTGLTVIVRPQPSIRGRITVDGVPANRAQVSAIQSTTAQESYQETDSTGRFQLRGMLPGRYEVSAFVPHGPRRTLQVTVEPAVDLRLDLELGGGAKLHGIVRAPDGSPVAGAEVVQVDADGLDVETATSDHGGRWEIDRLPAGPVRLHAHANGIGRVESAPFTLAEGESREVTLTLERGASIAGHVRWSDGTPASSVGVIAISMRAFDDRDLSSDSPATDSAADGRFRLLDLSPGRYRVTAYPPHADSMPAPSRPISRDETITGGHDLGDVDFVIPRADRSISGVVVGPDRTPIAGATVAASDGRLATWELAGAGVLTSGDGRFRVEGLGDGDFTLRASATGFGDAYAHAHAGAEGVTLALGVPARISGQVLDAAGRPVSDCVVMLESGEGLDGERSIQVHDAEGTFDLDGLGEGHYQIRAYQGRKSLGEGEPFDLAPGEWKKNVVIQPGS